MTRLVVHAGTHATDWRQIRQQLASWRQPLKGLGVRLCPGDGAPAWVAAARDITSGKPSQHLVEVANAAVADGAAALLLSSEQLEDSLRDPAAVSRLVAFAAGVGMELTVLLVLRDQLGYLNQMYCDRIGALQTARSFDSFVSAPQPAERFDYPRAFELVTGAPDVEVVGVPYAALTDGARAREVVTAAGLSRAQVDALPTGPGRRTRAGLPGPVLVAATRLLHKRLWRLGLVKSLPHPRLQAAARSLREHAEERIWDAGAFWGWSEDAREAAVQRYRPGNDALAKTLWGTPWPTEWESGAYLDVDLAALPPTLVVDVLRTVDDVVADLQKATGASPAVVPAD